MGYQRLPVHIYANPALKRMGRNAFTDFSNYHDVAVICRYISKFIPEVWKRYIEVN